LYPILFRLPAGWFGSAAGVPIFGYGVMLGLSTILGWFMSRRLAARKDGFSIEQTGWIFVGTVVSAMVGARLLYVLTNLERFETLRHVFQLSDGGLVAYGGFLGGFLGAWACCAATGRSVLAWGDAAAPAMGMGLFITRIGCLLYGCDYGQPCDWPWALRFPPGSPAYNTQRMEGLLPEHAAHSLAVHPSQLYESAVGLFLFLFATWLWRRRARRGEVMVAFTMAYAVLRFLLEFLRGDTQRGGYGGLSTSQIIGLFSFTAAGGLWIWMRRSGPVPTPALAKVRRG